MQGRILSHKMDIQMAGITPTPFILFHFHNFNFIYRKISSYFQLYRISLGNLESRRFTAAIFLIYRKKDDRIEKL